LVSHPIPSRKPPFNGFQEATTGTVPLPLRSGDGYPASFGVGKTGEHEPDGRNVARNAAINRRSPLAPLSPRLLLLNEATTGLGARSKRKIREGVLQSEGMMNEFQNIHSLSPYRQSDAAGVIARAFFNDPLILYYLPDPARRLEILTGMMRTCLRYCLHHGIVTSTPQLEGICCWLPPGKRDQNPLEWMRAGLGSFSRFPGFRTLLRILESERIVDQTHRQKAAQPHWYLMILAVDPVYHGQGFGSRLIQWVDHQPSNVHYPVYLETMNPRNVAFYQKNGFTTVHEQLLAAPDVRFWGLSRD
jgi:GNAT superfamily N-acetyltransferase